jgi:hypothetical protein
MPAVLVPAALGGALVAAALVQTLAPWHPVASPLAGTTAAFALLLFVFVRWRARRGRSPVVAAAVGAPILGALEGAAIGLLFAYETSDGAGSIVFLMGVGAGVGLFFSPLFASLAWVARPFVGAGDRTERARTWITAGGWLVVLATLVLARAWLTITCATPAWRKPLDLLTILSLVVGALFVLIGVVRGGPRPLALAAGAAFAIAIAQIVARPAARCREVHDREGNPYWVAADE